MKRFVSVATLVATVAASLLFSYPAHAEWVRDGVVKVSETIGTHTGTYAIAISGTIMRIETSADGSWSGMTASTGQVSGWARYRQDFRWNGGGTPSSSFTVSGSGSVTGSASCTGNICYAESYITENSPYGRVSAGGTATSTGTPDSYNVSASDTNRTVNTGGQSTASITLELSAASKAIYGSVGGGSGTGHAESVANFAYGDPQ